MDDDDDICDTHGSSGRISDHPSYHPASLLPADGNAASGAGYVASEDINTAFGDHIAASGVCNGFLNIAVTAPAA